MVAIRGEMRVKMNTAQIRSAGDEYAANFTKSFLFLATERAKYNVSPGVGPGPHPHRPYPFPQHTDTGNLASSVDSVIAITPSAITGTMWTSLKYGMDLELGWTSDAGNFYRYPWLTPAFTWATSNIDRNRIRFNLRDGGGRFASWK